MNMDMLAKQSIEAAAKLMGISVEAALNNKEAHNIAFKLSCAAMAEQKAAH